MVDCWHRTNRPYVDLQPAVVTKPAHFFLLSPRMLLRSQVYPNVRQHFKTFSAWHPWGQNLGLSRANVSNLDSRRDNNWNPFPVKVVYDAPATNGLLKLAKQEWRWKFLKMRKLQIQSVFSYLLEMCFSVGWFFCKKFFLLCCVQGRDVLNENV